MTVTTEIKITDLRFPFLYQAAKHLLGKNWSDVLKFWRFVSYMGADELGAVKSKYWNLSEEESQLRRDELYREVGSKITIVQDMLKEAFWLGLNLDGDIAESKGAAYAILWASCELIAGGIEDFTFVSLFEGFTLDAK